MHRLKTVLTVLGAATVLVLAGNTVVLAATGQSLTLGKINKANQVTVIKRTTPGPVLKLSTTSAGASPMVVNGQGKVANLNADKIDGKNSTAFAPASVSANTAIAAGHVDASGGLSHGRGVTSTVWDAANSRYIITLTGQAFDDAGYAPTVTPSNCSDVTFRYSSVDDAMVVYFRNAIPAPAQCAFAFTVHKLPG